MFKLLTQIKDALNAITTQQFHYTLTSFISDISIKIMKSGGDLRRIEM